MIDWSKPIWAIRKDGKRTKVSIDERYHNKTGLTPVKFPVNIFTLQASAAGTWYVDDEGLISCAKSPYGYEAHFTVGN